MALVLLAVAAAVAPPSARAAEPRRALPDGSLAHTRTGSYQGFALLPVDWQSPYALDEDGVPLVAYPFGTAYNPTTTAQYGLAAWTLGRRYRDRGRIEVALRMADWLVRTQERPSGRWLYRFPLDPPGAGVLPNPWWSALAQGQAISLLRRAYHRTGSRAYLLAARRGLRPFRLGVRRGGVLRHVRYGAFYEEYPTPGAPHLVLNGFMQALIGLYDLSDRSPVARRLFRRGMATLPRILPQYDLGDGRSLYSLVHLHWPTPPVAAPREYHVAHVGLLRLLDHLRPDPVLRGYARVWAAGGARS